MASNDPSLRRLARQLTKLEKDVHDLQTVPQLAHSSLDDQGLAVFDEDGNLTVTLGKQADGTWGAPPVRGPVPPAPVGVDAEGDAGVVRASWQGVFWAGAAKPMDFEAVQVLVDGLVYAAIHDPQGGSVSVPAMPGVRVVSFRTLSQAGMTSDATTFGDVTIEPRVSEQMQELGEDLTELREVTLPELSDELDNAASDLQSKLDAANARIDDIVVDGGGAGNFTTYSINEPSGDGTGEGDQWFRVVNGEVLGQWHWDGTDWDPVTLTDAIIAGIDLSKLVSNGNLSEIVANKMFTDIFSANKITAQELAVGAVEAENLAAGAILADKISGGAFTGETFHGGTFTGGLFQTDDDLPGKVEFANDAYITHLNGGGTFPGLRVTPIDTSNMEYPAGIGPGNAGLTIYGGQSKSGGSSIVQANPDGSFLRTFGVNGQVAGEIQTTAETSHVRTNREDGQKGGVIQTATNASLMRTYRENGLLGSNIEATANESSMRTNQEDGRLGGFMRTGADQSLMRTYSGDGAESGWARVRPQDAELAYVNANNNYVSRIYADKDKAYLSRGRSKISVEGDSLQVTTREGGGAGGVVDANADGVKVRRVNASNVAVCGLDTTNNAARIYGSDGTYTRGRIEVGRDGIVADSGRGMGFSVLENGFTVTGTATAQSFTGSIFRLETPPTASASANSFVAGGGTNGILFKISSSRRYKKNIVNWSPDPERVLALQPRQWQHNDPEQPGNPNNLSGKWNVGFVAEEVADLGLKPLVSYDGDGKGGWRPDGLNYDRFAAAHQVVLQKHEREIQDLRAENEELRSKLDTLTARLDAADI